MNIHRGCVYIFIYLILLCGNISTFSATIDVPADRPTIQSGIDAAKDGDTVLVADGIYRGEGNVNIDFKGKQITVKSQNGAKATIIDCGRKAETRGFTFHNEETNDSVLDGVTIRNGVHELGGGIYCNNASPTIKNCVITKNRSVAPNLKGQGGGGIYCFNSDTVITACKIIDNSANSGHGGGVLFTFTGIARKTKSQPSLINCTISKNDGDGVFCYDDVNPIIKDCTVSQNNGIGIVFNRFARGNNPITNCLITQNRGSGIDCRYYSYMNITDSIITRNRAEFGGGIYCDRSSIIEVSECVIAQNIATKSGGGIYLDLKWGHAEITHCTIAHNTAKAEGGGVYAIIEFSFFNLSNSIVWGNNTNGDHAEFAGGGRRITIKSCNIRDGLEGIGHEPDGDWFAYINNIDADPLFVDADREDYRLKENSPAAAMGAQSSSIRKALSVTAVGKKPVKWGELKRR